MGLRVRLSVVCASALLGGASLVLQACGSGDDDDPTARLTETEGGARETGTSGESDPESTCDKGNDLLSKVRDASIGDGASTTGLCGACIRAKCAQAVARCTADCPCHGIVGRSIECFLITQQIGCAVAEVDYLVTTETRGYALGLLGCVQSECTAECAIDGGGGPTDGGRGGDAVASGDE